MCIRDRLSADFSKQTLQARRGWKEVFNIVKRKDLHPRLIYPTKLPFRMQGQIKCFPDKVKLKEFIITKPLLYEMLRDLSKTKKIKTMNSKMTTNSQLSTNEPKKRRKTTKTKTKQITRTGTELEKWTSYRVFSVGRGRGRRWEGTGNKKHNW